MNNENNNIEQLNNDGFVVNPFSDDPTVNQVAEQQIDTMQQPVEPVVEKVVEPTFDNTEVIVNTPIQPEIQENLEQVKDDYKIQTELQNIPTVEQNKEQFINNVQTMNKERKEEKKEGVNFVFVIVLFVVILAAIYFLFPILNKYI